MLRKELESILPEFIQIILEQVEIDKIQMIKSALKPQKPSNNKVTADSDSDNSNNSLSDDKEEQDNNGEGKLSITQEEPTDSETLIKELSEDKTFMQVVIEEKQQNLTKAIMTRVIKTRKQKLLQLCCSPRSNEEVDPGENGAKHK
eukprot:7150248-Ditylum_brightwellii.AAC.1